MNTNPMSGFVPKGFWQLFPKIQQPKMLLGTVVLLVEA